MSNTTQRAQQIVAAYPGRNPESKPDYYRYHRYRFVALLDQIMQLPGKRILEIGVNPGQFTEMLVDAGYEVHGTDLFPEHRAELWQRLGVEVRRWNIDHEEPPYAAESFDLIIFSEVIEHLANPPLEALEIFHTLLKPGGHLVISTPNQFYFKSRMRTLFDVLFWQPFDHREEFERWVKLRSEARYYTHSRLFSLPQLEWMGQQSQFTVVAKSYHSAYERVGLEWPRILHVPHRWLIKALIALISAICPGARSMIMIALRK
ncbi:MAG: methyltransferase domain-containing protein [Chloroflexota bacterium]|jgi:SAM-dependent methyltransferase